MNIFSKLSLRNLRKNRSRTVITVVGVILATAMISGLTSLIFSFQGFFIKEQKATIGSWHLKYENISQTDSEIITSDEKIKDYVLSQEIGYAAVANKNVDKPYLYVMGIDDDFTKLVPLYLIEGDFPKKSDEIILPKHFIDSSETQYQIGDEISLGLGKRYLTAELDTEENNTNNTTNASEQVEKINPEMLENPEKYFTELRQRDGFYLDDGKETEILKVEQNKTYTISGFYNRPDFEEYISPGYTAITKADLSQTGYQLNCYLELTNYKDAYDFPEQESLRDISGTFEVNRDLLNYMGFSSNDNFMFMITGLAIIFFILIVLGSVVLISNAFTISLSERTKQFGLLSSIGASQKQLRKMIITEAMMISILGIPLGILGGILGIKLTLMGVNSLLADIITSSDNLVIPLELVISGKAIIFSVVLALLTVLISAWIPAKRASRVTAIDAIRQTQDVVAKPVRVSKFTYKVFGLPGFMAKKYYKNSRRKYRSTIVSLVLSIVLFISAYTFTSILQDSANNMYKMGTADIQYTLNINEPDIEIADMQEQITGLDSVTSVNYVVDRYDLGLLDADLLTKETQIDFEAGTDGQNIVEKIAIKGEEKYLSPVSLVFMNDQEMAKMLEQFNLNLEDYLKLEKLTPLVKNKNFYYDSAEKKYKDYDFFNEKREGVLEIVDFKEIDNFNYSGVAPEKSADGTSELIYYNFENDNINEKNISFAEALDKKLELQIKYFVDQVPDQLKDYDETILILPMSKISEFVSDYSWINYKFFIKSDNHLATENDLSQFNAEQENSGYITNFIALRQNNQNMTMILNIFSYGFIALISLIALTNVFNTITTNINLRTRDFAMLKSVGMSKKGIRKMMVFECFLYGTRSLIWGLPMALGISFLIHKSIDQMIEQSYQIPWLAIAVAVIAVFLFVALSMLFALNQINKKNIIDSLKNEND